MQQTQATICNGIFRASRRNTEQPASSLETCLLDLDSIFCSMALWPNLHLATLCNRDICRRPALTSHSGVLHFVHYIHTIDNLAEDNVLVVQKWGGYLKQALSNYQVWQRKTNSGNEELAAVAVFARVLLTNEKMLQTHEDLWTSEVLTAMLSKPGVSCLS